MNRILQQENALLLKIQEESLSFFFCSFVLQYTYRIVIKVLYTTQTFIELTIERV